MIDIDSIVTRHQIAHRSSEFIRMNGVNRGGMAEAILNAIDDIPVLIQEIERLREGQ